MGATKSLARILAQGMVERLIRSNDGMLEGLVPRNPMHATEVYWDLIWSDVCLAAKQNGRNSEERCAYLGRIAASGRGMRRDGRGHYVKRPEDDGKTALVRVLKNGALDPYSDAVTILRGVATATVVAEVYDMLCEMIQSAVTRNMKTKE